MKTPPVVSPPEWQVARQQLLVKEKVLTRSRDAHGGRPGSSTMPCMRCEEVEFDGPKAIACSIVRGRRHLIRLSPFFEPGVFGLARATPAAAAPWASDQVAYLAHLNALDTTLALRLTRAQATSRA